MVNRGTLQHAAGVPGKSALKRSQKMGEGPTQNEFPSQIRAASILKRL